MDWYHLAAGKAQGLKPASIVHEISRVSGLSDKDIGRIELHDKFSFIELPIGIPKAIFDELRNIKVAGQNLAVSVVKNNASRPKVSKGKIKSKSGKRKRKFNKRK